ncbi:GL24965 [Drosophila persimilis]|uniref:GL24965 n=1 Tax=Drosophila persimilis TaxID=7234 RepID=B4GU97_DROPE|nr:GL24965 [Drosophila persimilis]
MRTRSEWFLGPRDAVVSLQMPADTCSDCCLAAAAGYLGGGSTRDMRQAHADGDRNQAALLYHFYRRQQQEHESPQEQLWGDMMDTEDSYGHQREQQQQQQHIHSKGLLRPPQQHPHSHLHLHPQQQQPRRLLLDVNSGSYNAGLTNTNSSDHLAVPRHAFSLHEPLNHSCYYSTQCLTSSTTNRPATAAAVVVLAEEDSDCDSLDGGRLHTLQAHELQQHKEPRQSLLLLRHSTPMSMPRQLHRQRQRQRQQQRQRQRLVSNSSSLYQSFEEQSSSTMPLSRRSVSRLSNNNNSSSNGNHTSIGNIRLSNSAESIQYASRRPHASNVNSSLGGQHNPTRRLLINVPRQYRSSLRRNKEKQIGGNSQSNSSNSLGSDQLTAGSGPGMGTSASVNQALNRPLLMVGLLPAAEQPSSVRNSIAECGGSDGNGVRMDTLEHQLGVECSTTLSFKPPRL